MMQEWLAEILVCIVVVLWSAPARAQSSGSAESASSSASSAVWSHDAEGHVVIRATRIAEPIRADGQLDEAAYREVPPITEFPQQEPNNGAPISEKTEMWVLFDDRNLYISCRCWDTHPERIIANDMRRDTPRLGQQDNLAVELDTFHDRRNGVSFYLSPAGALRDGSTTDEKPNFDWNGIWDGTASRFDGGWIGEMVIPFKTLRYKPGREQTWGIQLRRVIASKNERGHVTLLSPLGAAGAIHRLSEAATLVGIEAPPPALNLEIKPYAITRVTTDLLSRPAIRNDVAPDAGLDLKYGVTKNLTADFTYNTDFAQVEADEAQVNLTRFNLSFPEKREFFLESQGTFTFGAGAGLGSSGSGDAPTLFYSRSIGLSGSHEVPVIVGARLTGKSGPWGVGVLNIETDDDPAIGAEKTNFTVVRLRHDVLRRSNIGGIFTRRSASAVADGANDVVGFDGNFALFQNVYANGYVAKSTTEGLDGDDMTYRAQLNYNADRYGLNIDRLAVGENFNPEVGFLRRENFRSSFLQARFSPRTTHNRIVRKYNYQGTFEYVTDNTNHLESRQFVAEGGAELQNSDIFFVQYQQLFEFVPESFAISRTARIPVGDYEFDNFVASYTGGEQRRIKGTASFEVGSFYDGNKTTAQFKGRVEVTPQLGIEPNISLNWIDLPQGPVTNTVLGGRATFTMTPRMFVAALVQYSSSNTSVLSNLRFRWEYQPGSELFVVYTEGRSSLPVHGTLLESRGVVVKINRLFRF